jgi:hypothetical protein
MAVAFWKLEDSFVKKFVGKQLQDRNGRFNAVPIFLDYPDIEEAPEQRFPSISVLFKNMIPDTDLFNSDMERVVSVDYSTSPPTFVKRRMAQFYDISYEVTSYSLSAASDRELTRWVESRLLPRDFIVVDDDTYHVFRDNFTVNDSVNVDTVIYEKTWEFTIKADIEDTDNDTYEKGVNEVRIHSNVVRTTSKIIEPTSTTHTQYVYNAPKNANTALDADKTLHRVIAFDDQDFWFIPKK